MLHNETTGPPHGTMYAACSLNAPDGHGALCFLLTWNMPQAGTFEERSVLDWAKGRLKCLVPGLSHAPLTKLEVKDVTGDAHIWIVRGKKRCAAFYFKHFVSCTVHASGYFK
jgi:hypothetical protein